MARKGEGGWVFGRQDSFTRKGMFFIMFLDWNENRKGLYIAKYLYYLFPKWNFIGKMEMDMEMPEKEGIVFKYHRKEDGPRKREAANHMLATEIISSNARKTLVEFLITEYRHDAIQQRDQYRKLGKKIGRGPVVFMPRLAKDLNVDASTLRRIRLGIRIPSNRLTRDIVLLAKTRDNQKTRDIVSNDIEMWRKKVLNEFGWKTK